MGERKAVRLGDVVDINQDVIDGEWPHSHIRYIDISSVAEGHLANSPTWMLLADAPSRAKRLLRKGDTVLSTVRPNRRSMFFASEPDSDWVVSTGFAVLRAKLDRLDPRFLYECVFDHFFTEYLISREKGAAYPAVSPQDIADAVIPFPPLHEQREIASLLAALGDKIELNRRMNKTLEGMARAIFKDWFVDFGPTRAKAEGRAQYLAPEIWTLFPDRLDDEDKPEGWKRMQLAQLADQCKGSVPPSRDPARIYEHFSLPAFDSGQVPAADRGEDIKSNKTPVPKGTILLSKLNPEISRVWLPNEPKDAPQIASTEFLVFKPKAPVGQGFLYCLFRSYSFKQMLEGMVTGTSKSHQRVSPTALLTSVVVTAENKAIQAFESVVEPLLAGLLANRAEASTLAKARNLLLPRLISGEIRVRDAEKVVEAVA